MQKDFKYFLAIAKTAVLRFKDHYFLYQNNYSYESLYKKEINLSFLTKNQREKLFFSLKNIDLERELALFQELNIQVIKYTDDLYPKLLKEIRYPPFILYLKGNIGLLNKEILAVVGSRKMSNYSKEVLQNILDQEFLENFIIVSGFARGVDSFAHKLAIENNGFTIAVLAYGFDKNYLYPSDNKQLFKEILLKNSLFLSEYYPGSKIFAQNFVQRNRIIAGLSKAVLIVEARHKSGSLITANFALENARDIFVVPASVFMKNFSASMDLIKDGANLCMDKSDILNYYALNINSPSLKSQIHFSNKKYSLILEQLYKAKTFDELLDLTKLDYLELSDILLQMEIKKIIQKKGLYYYF